MKTFIWFETLIIMTFYMLYIAILKILATLIGRYIIRNVLRVKNLFEYMTRSCNWYSENNVHIWEPKKAMALFEKELKK